MGREEQKADKFAVPRQKRKSCVIDIHIDTQLCAVVLCVCVCRVCGEGAVGGSHRAWFIWQLCGHGRDKKVYFKNFGSQLLKKRHGLGSTRKSP